MPCCRSTSAQSSASSSPRRAYEYTASAYTRRQTKGTTGQLTSFRNSDGQRYCFTFRVPRSGGATPRQGLSGRTRNLRDFAEEASENIFEAMPQELVAVFHESSPARTRRSSCSTSSSKCPRSTLRMARCPRVGATWMR
ncbi:MAG: hypothetical protein Q8S73_08705 [Deltaproteobacteria bacterium]|nr:hypothetical protein [Deltaproteobacteria bacterium]